MAQIKDWIVISWPVGAPAESHEFRKLSKYANRTREEGSVPHREELCALLEEHRRLRAKPLDEDLEYFGPFSSEDDARVFAEHSFDKDIDYKIMPLNN